jgi:hypothetical protein
MKKLILFSFFILLLVPSVQLFGKEEKEEKKNDSLFTGALTAGYVFKHDCLFKQIYGHGMVNVITGDGCYYPWEHWGLGVKVSYWRAEGKTTFLKHCSLLQEVPVTFYLRKRKDFDCGLQLYGSLGGGVIWMQEKSYLGKVHSNKGIGELEIGVNYPAWHWINVTGAFRYLFPRQTEFCRKVDVGGCDLRAGIGFSF